MMFESDYLERDPYKKLATGLAHAWLGGFLVFLGLPIWAIMVGYVLWEVISGLMGFKPRVWRLWADSAVDAAFVYLGAALVAYMDVRFGFGILAMGAAYFIANRKI